MAGRDRSSLFLAGSVLPRGGLTWDSWWVSLTWVLQTPAELPSLPMPTDASKRLTLPCSLSPGPELVLSRGSDFFPEAPCPEAASYPCVSVMYLPPPCSQASPFTHQISPEGGGPALLTPVKHHPALRALPSRDILACTLHGRSKMSRETGARGELLKGQVLRLWLL